MKRVICIGNRYEPRDAAGPLTYDELQTVDVPADVEIIDGGLSGLDLLRFLSGAQRVVFVDAVAGDAPPGVVVLDAEAAAARADGAYGHTAGLAYLLRVAPLACETPLPEILLVGVEGMPNRASIAAAAELSLQLAVEGPPTNGAGRAEHVRARG